MPPSSAGQRRGAMRASATAAANTPLIGEHPPGVVPAGVGLHRPHDRDSAVRNVNASSSPATHARRARAPRREALSAAADEHAAEPSVSAISAVGHRFEVQAAFGVEGDEADAAPAHAAASATTARAAASRPRGQRAATHARATRRRAAGRAPARARSQSARRSRTRLRRAPAVTQQQAGEQRTRASPAAASAAC